jgi:hypothetical protein
MRSVNLIYYILISTLLLTITGCSRNYYNISRDDYEKRVRVIGIAPIFVDADSDIRYPDKEAIINILKNSNRKNEPELLALLKDTGSYYMVQQIEGDAEKLFATLLFRRERRDDAGISYNKYFYKPAELNDLMSRNKIDALMLVVVGGITTKETVYSNNYFAKLEAEYNNLIISSQIVDRDNNILWEFPNFRKHRLDFPVLLTLQYPDFDEAKANVTEKVEVKYKTVPGITRAFDKSSRSDLRSGAQVSDLYSNIFEEMVSLLRIPFSFGSDKKSKPVAQLEQPEPSAPLQTPSTPQPSSPKEIPASQPPPATHSPIPAPQTSIPANPASVPPPPVAPLPLPAAPSEQITSPAIAPPT